MMGEMNLQQILKNKGGGKPSIISTSLKYFLWPAIKEKHELKMYGKHDKYKANILNSPSNNENGLNEVHGIISVLTVNIHDAHAHDTGDDDQGETGSVVVHQQ